MNEEVLDKYITRRQFILNGFIMTSHRQRLQPDHRMECYAYPTSIFYDNFYPITDESFADIASTSETEGAHQSIFECDAHIGSHCRDLSTIAYSSSGPSLQSEMNQTENANIIGPPSSKNLSCLIPSYHAGDHQINVPSMIHDQYNSISKSFYQKRKENNFKIFHERFSNGLSSRRGFLVSCETKNKFISAHQAEFQFAKALLMKIMASVNQIARDVICPGDRQANGTFQGLARRIQDAQSDGEDQGFLTDKQNSLIFQLSGFFLRKELHYRRIAAGVKSFYKFSNLDNEFASHGWCHVMHAGVKESFYKNVQGQANFKLSMFEPMGCFGLISFSVFFSQIGDCRVLSPHLLPLR
ncbi:hypothetical protein SADUNF_Sadunf16G0184100 [Salix dunnii]|uniref:Uncharacterized protein n=1 Tax=Salix dunnii TaxID=1413687 RepID=A0A835MGV7_9ROSI|nr:hypothetical protein SADUNF_Sadunf16G0184100 [Salix dunnii]